jgi:hypothetical protein
MLNLLLIDQEMTRQLFLCLLMLAPAFLGCAAVHAPQPPPMTDKEQAEFGQKLEQLMRDDEKAFDALNRKMDEYQNLLVLCDSITQGKEAGGIAAACEPRLKSLKQELDELSDLLRGGK